MNSNHLVRAVGPRFMDHTPRFLEEDAMSAILYGNCKRMASLTINHPEAMKALGLSHSQAKWGMTSVASNSSVSVSFL